MKRKEATPHGPIPPAHDFGLGERGGASPVEREECRSPLDLAIEGTPPLETMTATTKRAGTFGTTAFLALGLRDGKPDFRVEWDAGGAKRGEAKR